MFKLKTPISGRLPLHCPSHRDGVTGNSANHYIYGYAMTSGYSKSTRNGVSKNPKSVPFAWAGSANPSKTSRGCLANRRTLVLSFAMLCVYIGAVQQIIPSQLC